MKREQIKELVEGYNESINKLEGSIRVLEKERQGLKDNITSIQEVQCRHPEVEHAYNNIFQCVDCDSILMDSQLTIETKINH